MIKLVSEYDERSCTTRAQHGTTRTAARFHYTVVGETANLPWLVAIYLGSKIQIQEKKNVSQHTDLNLLRPIWVH